MGPSHAMSLASFASCESLSLQEEAGGMATSQEPTRDREDRDHDYTLCPSQLVPDGALEDEPNL